MLCSLYLWRERERAFNFNRHTHTNNKRSSAKGSVEAQKAGREGLKKRTTTSSLEIISSGRKGNSSTWMCVCVCAAFLFHCLLKICCVSKAGLTPRFLLTFSSKQHTDWLTECKHLFCVLSPPLSVMMFDDFFYIWLCLLSTCSRNLII